MKKWFRNFWWNCLPLLHVHIQIPFFEVQTTLMERVWEYEKLSYMVWYVRIFRWKFAIDLFRNFRKK